jgi:U32 family peptidase
MAKNCVPELLAPAGSIDALKAAVNAGADAIYLSGKKFGAREFATNFSRSEIEEGLRYAKLRGVKVYVTVNTLINDSQILSVAEYLIWLYKTGIDAVIIQDLGIACLSREIVPNLDMHASTQMTIHNIKGVEWASKFGFKRIILSRELGISEVKEIKRETVGKRVEIEIFVHGALCYSYSGQCLLSSFIGGRSGNKGMCAQPCRKKYTLLSGKVDEFGRPVNLHPIDLKEEYLLSTRDLAVYENLDSITDFKVDSLKIEGRMRSAEYVGIVVKIYRKALNLISAGNLKTNDEDISKLKLAFNRGFTGGYLTESNEKSVMGRDAPGNQGLYIGKVQQFNIKTNIIVVKLENNFNLEKGDGIAFLSPIKHSNKFESFGMALENTPEYKQDKLILNVGRPVKVGSKLYLTRSKSLNHEAKGIMNNKTKPSIPIDIIMSWDDDLKAHLRGEFNGFDGMKHAVQLKSHFKMEKALKKPLSRDQIENQLQKTGNTPFVLRNVSIKYSEDLFAPISKLNQFRREFLEKSKDKLLETYKPSEFEVQAAENRFKNIEKSFMDMEYLDVTLNSNGITLSVYSDTLDNIKGALEAGAKRVYFEPNPTETCNDNCNPCSQICANSLNINEDVDLEEDNRISLLLISAKNLCDNYNAEFIWKWPQITHQNQINHYYKILESQLELGLKEVMVDGLGAATGIRQVAPNLKLSGSAGLNIWNRKTVLILSKIFSTLTTSAELSKEDLSSVIINSRLEGIKNRFEIVVQGNVDALISKDCLLSIVPQRESSTMKNQFWGIQDVRQKIFPVKIDSEGHTHILNSVELCLVDYLPKISQMGIDSIVVDVRNKPYDYAKKMTSIYSKGLGYIENDLNTDRNINRLKSQIKLISTGGITTGNFLKGVKER